MNKDLKINQSLSFIEDVSKHYFYLKDKKYRLEKINEKLLKREEKTNFEINKLFGREHFIKNNLENISSALVNLKVAIFSTEDEDLGKQYCANFRKIVSLLNSSTDIEDIAFTLINSNILKKSGLNFHISGLESLILLSKGYTLCHVENDHRVKLKGNELIYQFPSVGIYNKQNASRTNNDSLSYFLQETFSIDINNIDLLNQNDELYYFSKRLKNSEKCDIFYNDQVLTFRFKNSVLYCSKNSSDFEIFNENISEFLNIVNIHFIEG